MRSWRESSRQLERVGERYDLLNVCPRKNPKFWTPTKKRPRGRITKLWKVKTNAVRGKKFEKQKGFKKADRQHLDTPEHKLWMLQLLKTTTGQNMALSPLTILKPPLLSPASLSTTSPASPTLTIPTPKNYIS